MEDHLNDLNDKHFNYLKLIQILSSSQKNFKKIIESLIIMSNEESNILNEESSNYIEKKFSDIFEKMKKENKSNEDNSIKILLKNKLDILKKQVQELNDSKRNYEKQNEINELENKVKEIEEKIKSKKKDLEILKNENKALAEKIDLILKEKDIVDKKLSKAQLYIYINYPDRVEEVFQNNPKI